MIYNKNKENNIYITLSEASKISGVSRDYLNVLIHREKLRAIKIGKNWLTTQDWISTLRASRGGIKTGDNQYLSLFNAARTAGVSAGYLNVAVRRGKLRAVKLGRNWFTTREWVDEYQKSVGRPAITAEVRLQEFPEVGLRVPKFFTEREKQLQTEALLPEIKLSSRELKSEEKSIILESAFAKAVADKAVKEKFKSADVLEFQKISKQLGILKSLKSWSHFKFSLASGLVVILLAVSVGLAFGLIPGIKDFAIPGIKELSSKFQTQASKFQASIFSDVFKNFPSDLPSFSEWLASGLDKSLSLFKSKSLSELAVETLESGKSKLLKPEEAPYPINTLAEAETLDSPSESAQLAEAEGEIPAGGLIVSVGGSEFRLLENRLSVVETDLKDQTDLINSELSLQKKTILGVIETMFGIARMVPSHPISTIVVQGQPATLTSYSVQPQVNTGFDRLSASYLTLSHNAEINGSLTVKSGGTFDKISVSGATTLTGNATIGGTLSVTGDTTLNNLTLNGTLSLPGSATLGNASSTYLTVSNTAWLNQLKVTGTATTTFNSPITSSSGNLIVAADSANNILLNPYGGNVGIGTSSPNNILTIAGAATPSLGLTTNSGLSGWTMGIDTADANKFKIASSTAVGTNARLTIDGAGNVGIGTTSPGSLFSVNSTGNAYIGGDLTVSGAVTFQSSTSFSSGFNLTGILTQTASSTSSIISSIASSTATHYSFDARGAGPIFNILKNNSSKFYIDNLGNVGVATTTVPGGFGFNIATSTFVYGNQFISGGLGIGLATTTSGALQTSGDVFVGRNLYVSGNSTTLGASSADSLTVNSSINSNLIPDVNAVRDIGSSAFYWDDAFIDTLTVNNISAASTTIAGTQSETFTINSDNNSTDSQNAEIIFYRGTVVPNALFTWNSATSSKRFELNQVLYINNGSASTTNPTFTIKTIANQTANGLQVIDNNSSAYFTVSPIGSNTTILNASSTNFSVSGSTFLGNATTTGLTVQGGTLLGSLSAANATFSNATSTGGFSVTGGTQLNSLAFTVGTSTSFGVTGGTSLGSLDVTGLTNLGNLIAGNATTTGLTVNGGTLLGSLSAGAITVTSCNGCGIGGNNSLQNTYNSSTSSPQIILSSAGQNGLFIQDSALGLHLPLFQINGQSGTSTLFSVSATSTNWGVGALMQNATTTGLTVSGGSSLGSLSALNISVSNATTTGLSVNGGSLIGSLSAANSTFTNATSTGGFSVTGGTQLNSLAFTVGTSTSFGVTGGTSLGSLGVTGLTNLGNLIAGNATTTGLTVNGGTLLGSLVASNATFTTATTSALSVTGGSQFAAASFSGNVGIGTTNPNFSGFGSPQRIVSITPGSGTGFGVIELQGLTTGTADESGRIQFIRGTDMIAQISVFTDGATNQGSLQFSTQTTERMRISTSGKVGIGTTTPGTMNAFNITGALMHISNFGTGGTISQLLIDGSGQGILGLNDSGAAVNSRWWQLLSDGGDFTLRSLNDNEAVKTTVLTATGGGNVGIGTTTPNNLLSISSATTPAVGFTTATGFGWTVGMDTADSNKFKIASSTAVGTNARLTIDGNGNVGIGTTTPGNLLSVHSTGNVYFGGALTVSGNALFQNATTTGLSVNGGTLLGSLSAGAATTTSLSVTGGGLFGALGVTGNSNLGNATTTGLTVQGGSSLGSLIALNSSFSNATSTGGFSVSGGTQLNSLAFTVGTSTSFTVTGGASLGSLGVTGNANLGNATTTGLSVNGGTLLGSLVASNATFTTATTSALSVTGGSQFAAASFSGNVGIGITNPDGRVRFFGNPPDAGGSPSAFYVQGGADEYVAAFGNTNVIALGTKDGYSQVAALNSNLTNWKNMVLNAGGSSVSIGTTNFGSRFNVNANVSIGSGYTGTAAPLNGMIIEGNVGIGTSTGLWARTTIDGGGSTSATAALSVINSASTSLLFVRNDGNVGIGTTSPGSKLELGSGVLTVPGGSVSAPSYTFTGDTNTGIYSPNADNLNISTAGVRRINIDSAGKIGLGGDSATGAVVAITGNIGMDDGSRIGYLTGGSSQYYGYTPAVGAVSGGITAGEHFRINIDSNNDSTTNSFVIGNNQTGFNDVTNNVLLIVQESGNVGIGTTTPNNLLSISSATTPALGFTTATGFGWTVGMDTNDSNKFKIASSTAVGTNARLTIDGNGNVGIGTTTPTQLLTISKAGATANANIPNGWLCVDNDGGCVGGTAGSIYYVAAVTGNSDVAENYYSTDLLEPGDIILTLGGKNISKATASSTAIIGVVSTAPGLTLGFDETANASSTYPVALIGRVPVKVSLENGPIAVGDRISVSSAAGVGKKASLTEATVGIALEGTSDIPGTSDVQKIMVFVNLGQPRLSGAQGTGDLAAMTTASGDLNMNGFSILNVKSITGMNGLWKIDENGNIMAQSVETQKLTVGGGIASGVTIYDRETTAPKCIYIEGGVIKTSDGACGATQNAGTAAIITASSPVPTAVSTTTPISETIPVATSTPVVATSTEPILAASETVVATSTAAVVISTTTPETATSTP